MREESLYIPRRTREPTLEQHWILTHHTIERGAELVSVIDAKDALPAVAMAKLHGERIAERLRAESRVKLGSSPT